VPPRDLSNSLLDDCVLGPGLGERAHVHEVRSGEPAEVGEHLAQVMGQAFDDFAAPSLVGLAVEDVPADLPVEPEQFGVDRQRGTLPGGVDAVLEASQPVRVPLGRVGESRHLVGHRTSLSAASRNSQDPSASADRGTVLSFSTCWHVSSLQPASLSNMTLVGGGLRRPPAVNLAGAAASSRIRGKPGAVRGPGAMGQGAAGAPRRGPTSTPCLEPPRKSTHCRDMITEGLNMSVGGRSITVTR
jgi:hypothetical protein